MELLSIQIKRFGLYGATKPCLVKLKGSSSIRWWIAFASAAATALMQFWKQWEAVTSGLEGKLAAEQTQHTFLCVKGTSDNFQNQFTRHWEHNSACENICMSPVALEELCQVWENSFKSTPFSAKVTAVHVCICLCLYCTHQDFALLESQFYGSCWVVCLRCQATVSHMWWSRLVLFLSVKIIVNSNLGCLS